MPVRKVTKGKSRKTGYTQAEKLAYYKKLAGKRYGGRGAYSAPNSAAVGASIGRGIGSIGSFIPGVGAIAGPVLGLLGEKVGGYLANKLGTYMGWGDYRVNRNSLTIPEGNSPAAMHNSGQTTRVCHREYICDIVTSNSAGQFKIESFPLQPGDPSTFPWVAELAQKFQKYRFLGAIVEFKSMSGDAITGTNTALGEVIISTNYNNADPNFINRSQMENTQYCSSAKPSVSFVHIIECDPKLQAQEMLYVSPTATPEVGLTVNEINWCNVQVATVGMQGTAVKVGSLYVTYELELVQPIELSLARGPAGDWFSGTGGSIIAPFGTAPLINLANSIGGSISPTTYVFPDKLAEGLFLVTYNCTGGGATIITPDIGVSGNVVLRDILGEYTTNEVHAPQDGVLAVTQYIIMFVVEVTGRPNFPGENYFGFAGGAIPPAQTASNLMVNSINGRFYYNQLEMKEAEEAEMALARSGLQVPMPSPQWDLGTTETEKQIEYLKQKLKLLELQRQVKEFDLGSTTITTPQ